MDAAVEDTMEEEERVKGDNRVLPDVIGETWTPWKKFGRVIADTRVTDRRKPAVREMIPMVLCVEVREKGKAVCCLGYEKG